MTERPPGTRRNRGLALMAVGVAFLILFIFLSLNDVTTEVARASKVIFIVGIAILAAGAVLYGLARSPRI